MLIFRSRAVLSILVLSLSNPVFAEVITSTVTAISDGDTLTLLPGIANVVTVDKYKQSVARVSCDGIDANLEQVRRGMAWRYLKYSKDRSIEAAEEEARERGRGLWSEKDPVAPWEFRKRKGSQTVTLK